MDGPRLAGATGEGPATSGPSCSMTPEQAAVRTFHDLVGLRVSDMPNVADRQTRDLRIRFLREELKEFTEACHAGDLVGIAPALAGRDIRSRGIVWNRSG